MPATTSSPNKARPEGNGKFRFAKCDLTDGQKEDLKRWREDGADIERLTAYLDQRVAGGHTLGLKGQDVGYMAILTGIREQSGHMDVCLTARASSPLNALFALQYKDELLLKGKWEVSDRLSELDL